MKRSFTLLGLALVLGVLIWQGGALISGGGESAVDPETPHSAELENGQEDPASQDLQALDDSSTLAAERSAPELDSRQDAGVTSATHGTLLLRTARTDGTPVPGVTVYITPKRGARLGHGTSEYVTDDEGVARSESLTPGSFSIYCPRGPRERSDVVAGEETEVLLEFKGVVDVRGIVRDPDGRPVANADVWVASWRRDWLGTQQLTRTGAGGEFSVQSVHPRKSLGATAPGFSPSELVDLELVDTELSPVQVELVLRARGGGLTGRVLDPGGKPLADARVAVGKPPEEYSMRSDGTTEESWCPRVQATDASGSFSFEGLEAGLLALHVLAHDHPEYQDEVEIPVGETAHEEVQLTHGMSVKGTILGEAGEAIPDAIVMALDAPFVDPFPTQGPTEPGSPFHRPATRSDDQGNFLLDRLPAGDAHLYASKGTSYWDDGKFLGTLQETLIGEAGQVLEWDPVLTLGHQIRGRVTYADDRPMGNVFVSATDDDERRYTEHADTEGRFAIPGLENRPYLVAVQLSSLPDGAKPLERTDVWPSPSELVLTASFSKVVLEKGTARVRIDDRAGRIDGKGGVVFAHLGGWYFTDEEDGVYSTELPPGRYQARAMNGDDVVGSSEWFDLAPGEDRDIGSIVTRSIGSIVVRIVRPPELADNLVAVSVETDYGPRTGGHTLEPDEREHVFENLLEGPATVTLGGEGVAIESRTVEVQGDGPTILELRVRPAWRVTIHVTATPTDGFGKLDIELHHANGERYASLPYYERWGARLPLDAHPHLPEGRFTVTATTTSGLSATGELVIDATAAAATLDLNLE